MSVKVLSVEFCDFFCIKKKKKIYIKVKMNLKFLFIFIIIIFVKCSYYEINGECPPIQDADSLSQTQLLEQLTNGCRYDRLERPVTYTETGARLPVDVYVRAYVYFMQNLEAHDLQFTIYALLQLRYLDPRLAFRKVAPKRRQPILGEKQLRDTLWMPHLFLANERDSNILGTDEKDILTSISPDGTVIISNRIKATLYCWMNLQKFPFDEQRCATVFESWMYNTSELVLHWENKRPITFNPELHLTEYTLHGAGSNKSIINADLNDLRHGAFAGNYSSLSFTVHLTREVGFYIMDYFLPSVLIVGISWVSFWLQADQAPPRIMLGTSTMLTFITLASAQGKILPKVSYIKVPEIWFLGCTCFIFGSLLEFAFVNTIWRRKTNVDVKKLNSKNILKSTLSPRASRRKNIRSHSLSYAGRTEKPPLFDNYLTVHNFPITTIREGETMNQHNNNNNNSSNNNNNNKVTFMTKTFNTTNTISNDSLNECAEERQQNIIDLESGKNGEHNANNGWTTLTPQQISMWIDSKARIIFPMSFLVFNIFFWTFVYVL